MSRWCAMMQAAGLAAAAALLGIAPARAANPDPLPQDVVAAWTAAGMDVGWAGRDMTFPQGDAGKPGEIPAFQIGAGGWPTGKLGKLPQPPRTVAGRGAGGA